MIKSVTSKKAGAFLSCGMTLTEVMIACSILSAMALFTVEVAQIFRQTTQVGARTQALIALVSEIRERLKYSELCDKTIGPASTFNQNNFDLTQPEIKMKLPNIHSGVTMSDDFLAQGQAILPLRLNIKSLRFGELRNISGTKYVAQVYVTAEGLDGFKLKPMPVTSLVFNVTGTSPTASIASCAGVESGVSKQICESMGCVWQPLASPPCGCTGTNGVCPIGELPVAFKAGVADCRPLGGKACNANQYLIGVTIEKSYCAPIY